MNQHPIPQNSSRTPRNRFYLPRSSRNDRLPFLNSLIPRGVKISKELPSLSHLRMSKRYKDNAKQSKHLEMCLLYILSRRACGHVDVGTCPHKVLAATLTLSQPGGEDYAHPILVSTPSFESHRRACSVIYFCMLLKSENQTLIQLTEVLPVFSSLVPTEHIT